MKNQETFKNFRTVVKYWDNFNLELYYKYLKTRECQSK
jgi:hypothetical protein